MESDNNNNNNNGFGNSNYLEVPEQKPIDIFNKVLNQIKNPLASFTSNQTGGVQHNLKLLEKMKDAKDLAEREFLLDESKYYPSLNTPMFSIKEKQQHIARGMMPRERINYGSVREETMKYNQMFKTFLLFLDLEFEEIDRYYEEEINYHGAKFIFRPDYFFSKNLENSDYPEKFYIEVYWGHDRNRLLNKKKKYSYFPQEKHIPIEFFAPFVEDSPLTLDFQIIMNTIFIPGETIAEVPVKKYDWNDNGAYVSFDDTLRVTLNLSENNNEKKLDCQTEIVETDDEIWTNIKDFTKKNFTLLKQKAGLNSKMVRDSEILDVLNNKELDDTIGEPNLKNKDFCVWNFGRAEKTNNIGFHNFDIILDKWSSRHQIEELYNFSNSSTFEMNLENLKKVRTEYRLDMRELIYKHGWELKLLNKEKTKLKELYKQRYGQPTGQNLEITLEGTHRYKNKTAMFLHNGTTDIKQIMAEKQCDKPEAKRIKKERKRLKETHKIRHTNLTIGDGLFKHALSDTINDSSLSKILPSFALTEDSDFFHDWEEVNSKRFRSLSDGVMNSNFGYQLDYDSKVAEAIDYHWSQGRTDFDLNITKIFTDTMISDGSRMMGDNNTKPYMIMGERIFSNLSEMKLFWEYNDLTFIAINPKNKLHMFFCTYWRRANPSQVNRMRQNVTHALNLLLRQTLIWTDDNSCLKYAIAEYITFRTSSFEIAEMFDSSLKSGQALLGNFSKVSEIIKEMLNIKHKYKIGNWWKSEYRNIFRNILALKLKPGIKNNKNIPFRDGVVYSIQSILEDLNRVKLGDKDTTSTYHHKINNLKTIVKMIGLYEESKRLGLDNGKATSKQLLERMEFELHNNVDYTIFYCHSLVYHMMKSHINRLRLEGHDPELIYGEHARQIGNTPAWNLGNSKASLDLNDEKCKLSLAIARFIEETHGKYITVNDILTEYNKIIASDNLIGSEWQTIWYWADKHQWGTFREFYIEKVTSRLNSWYQDHFFHNVCTVDQNNQILSERKDEDIMKKFTKMKHEVKEANTRRDKSLNLIIVREKQKENELQEKIDQYVEGNVYHAYMKVAKDAESEVRVKKVKEKLKQKKKEEKRKKKTQTPQPVRKPMTPQEIKKEIYQKQENLIRKRKNLDYIDFQHEQVTAQIAPSDTDSDILSWEQIEEDPLTLAQEVINRRIMENPFNSATFKSHLITSDMSVTSMKDILQNLNPIWKLIIITEDESKWAPSAENCEYLGLFQALRDEGCIDQNTYNSLVDGIYLKKYKKLMISDAILTAPVRDRRIRLEGIKNTRTTKSKVAKGEKVPDRTEDLIRQYGYEILNKYYDSSDDCFNYEITWGNGMRQFGSSDRHSAIQDWKENKMGLTPSMIQTSCHSDDKITMLRYRLDEEVEWYICISYVCNRLVNIKTNFKKTFVSKSIGEYLSFYLLDGKIYYPLTKKIMANVPDTTYKSVDNDWFSTHMRTVTLFENGAPPEVLIASRFIGNVGLMYKWGFQRDVESPYGGLCKTTPYLIATGGAGALVHQCLMKNETEMIGALMINKQRKEKNDIILQIGELNYFQVKIPLSKSYFGMLEQNHVIKKKLKVNSARIQLAQNRIEENPSILFRKPKTVREGMDKFYLLMTNPSYVMSQMMYTTKYARSKYAIYKESATYTFGNDMNLKYSEIPVMLQAKGELHKNLDPNIRNTLAAEMRLMSIRLNRALALLNISKRTKVNPSEKTFNTYTYSFDRVVDLPFTPGDKTELMEFILMNLASFKGQDKWEYLLRELREFSYNWRKNNKNTEIIDAIISYHKIEDVFKRSNMDIYRFLDDFLTVDKSTIRFCIAPKTPLIKQKMIDRRSISFDFIDFIIYFIKYEQGSIKITVPKLVRKPEKRYISREGFMSRNDLCLRLADYVLIEKPSLISFLNINELKKCIETGSNKNSLTSAIASYLIKKDETPIRKLYRKVMSWFSDINIDGQSYMGYGLTLGTGTVVIGKKFEHEGFQIFFKGHLNWSLVNAVLTQLNAMTMRRRSMTFRFDLGPEYKKGFRLQSDRTNRYHTEGLYFLQTEVDNISINGESVIEKGTVTITKDITQFSGVKFPYHHELWWDEKLELIPQASAFSFDDFSIKEDKLNIHFDILGTSDMVLLDTVFNTDKCFFTMKNPDDQDFNTIQLILNNKYASSRPRDRMWIDVVKKSNLSGNKQVVFTSLATNFDLLTSEEQTQIFNILNHTSLSVEEFKNTKAITGFNFNITKLQTQITESEYNVDMTAPEIYHDEIIEDDSVNNNNNIISQKEATVNLIDLLTGPTDREQELSPEVLALFEKFDQEDLSDFDE